MDTKKCLAEFQIVGSRIKQIKMKNDFVLLDSPDKTKKKLDLTHKVVEVEKDEQGILRGILSLQINVVLTEGKTKFQLFIEIEGCFSCPDSDEEDKFQQMLEINGVTTLYGIARAMIISLTSQAFMAGAVTLPMINVYQYSKRISEDEESIKDTQ